MARYSPKQLRTKGVPVTLRTATPPPLLENKAVVEPIPVAEQRAKLLQIWDSLDPPSQQVVLNLAMALEREAQKRAKPTRPRVETVITPRGTMKTVRATKRRK